MNKKRYINPVVEALNSEIVDVVCASFESGSKKSERTYWRDNFVEEVEDRNYWKSDEFDS